MRTIHERGDAALTTQLNDLLNRKDQCGLGGDVIDHQHARVRREGFGDRIHEIVDRRTGSRQVERANGCTMSTCRILRCFGDGAVTEVGHEDLIAGFEGERLQDGIGSGGRVLDEAEQIGVTAHEIGHRLGGHAHVRVRWIAVGFEVGQFAQQELGGLALDLVLKRTLMLDHHTRRCADGSVVEISDGRVEQETIDQMAAELQCHVRPPAGSGRSW